VRTEDHRSTIRVACVGDSITFGLGVEGRSTNHYPAVLGRLLGPRFETRNFGVSGATMLKQGDRPYWKRRELRAADAYAPHVVVLELGTNDAKPHNWRRGAHFEHDVRAMIEHFRALPPRPKLWLCLPPPVFDPSFERVLSQEIRPRLRKVAAEAGVPLIDLYGLFRDAPELFPDRVHPNAAGARLIARAVRAALTGAEPTAE
jgi:lysophospholipase L1-like esterase